jgi:hypothetical protein
VKYRPLKPVVKAILIIVLLLVSFFIAFTGYLTFYKHAHRDSKYDFILFDQRDWYSMPPQEGVYYSVATGNLADKKIISSFGIAPINKSSITIEDSFDLAREQCYEDPQLGIIDFSQTKLGVNTAFLCVKEVKPDHTNEMYIFKQLIVLSSTSGKYDYMIFASYPKNNAVEEEKLDRIINNFRPTAFNN